MLTATAVSRPLKDLKAETRLLIVRDDTRDRCLIRDRCLWLSVTQIITGYLIMLANRNRVRQIARSGGESVPLFKSNPLSLS